MKEYWIKIKGWWVNLKPREKKASATGGIVVAFLLVYSFVWAPLQNLVETAREHIVSEQKLLAFMQAADESIRKLQSRSHETGKTKITTPVALLTLLQKAVNQAELSESLTQLKQSSNNSVEMRFQKVTFDKFIAMLDLLSQEDVLISRLSVSAESTQGLVNAEITFQIA